MTSECGNCINFDPYTHKCEVSGAHAGPKDPAVDCKHFTLKESPDKEMVDHPAHYNTGKYEVIDVLEDWGFEPEFSAACVIKYVARHMHKGNPLRDLRKAKWYLNRLIEMLEKEQSK